MSTSYLASDRFLRPPRVRSFLCCSDGAMTSECALPAQPLPAAEPVTFMKVGISTVGFALSRRITSRASASTRFKREADRILGCAQKLDPALAAKTILVER